jgi:hypothetical protein
VAAAGRILAVVVAVRSRNLDHQKQAPAGGNKRLPRQAAAEHRK